MPTQMNFDKGSSYTTPSPTSSVNHSCSNFDGGRITKQAGKNNTSPQVNFDVGMKIPYKQTSSHFGEKPLTGNDNGY